MQTEKMFQKHDLLEYCNENLDKFIIVVFNQVYDITNFVVKVKLFLGT